MFVVYQLYRLLEDSVGAVVLEHVHLLPHSPIRMLIIHNPVTESNRMCQIQHSAGNSRQKTKLPCITHHVCRVDERVVDSDNFDSGVVKGCS